MYINTILLPSTNALCAKSLCIDLPDGLNLHPFIHRDTHLLERLKNAHNFSENVTNANEESHPAAKPEVRESDRRFVDIAILLISSPYCSPSLSNPLPPTTTIYSFSQHHKTSTYPQNTHNNHDELLQRRYRSHHPRCPRTHLNPLPRRLRNPAASPQPPSYRAQLHHPLYILHPTMLTSCSGACATRHLLLVS